MASQMLLELVELDSPNKVGHSRHLAKSRRRHGEAGRLIALRSNQL